MLPEVPLPKNEQPTWPKKQFKKDGSPTQAAIKYYGEGHSVYRTDIIVRKGPMNLRNPKHVQDFLLSQGWQPTEWNLKRLPDGTTIRKSPKLTEDSFESIKGELGQQVALLRKCNSRRDTLTSWIEGTRPDGRIPTPISGKAATHRLRHSLVVNVPRAEDDRFFGREMREPFVASQGMVMVGCDSEACQLRMLAEEMYRFGVGDDAFTHALVNGRKEDGTDPHTLNKNRVNAILGRELVTRTHTKTITFGSIFGAGPAKVAAMIGCDVETAKQVLKVFFEVMPGVLPLRRLLKDFYKAHGYIEALDGRRTYDIPERALLVDLMQMDEAASMEIAMVKAHVEVSKQQIPAWQLIYYHDELDWETYPEYTSILKGILEDSINWSSRFLDMRVPLKGEAKIGHNWAEVH